jgi:hypothetical protein
MKAHASKKKEHLKRPATDASLCYFVLCFLVFGCLISFVGVLAFPSLPLSNMATICGGQEDEDPRPIGPEAGRNGCTRCGPFCGNDGGCTFSRVTLPDSTHVVHTTDRRHIIIEPHGYKPHSGYAYNLGLL